MPGQFDVNSLTMLSLNISNQIKELLSLHPLELKELVNKITGTNDDKILHTIRVMIDNKMLTHNPDKKLCLVV